MLDPANGYAQTSFALQPGVAAANQQFAIGVNGNLYLADGLGDGATYSAAGVFLNTFHPPSLPFYASPEGLSYVRAQPDGHICVYDLHKGYIHQYLDQSVVDSLAPTARPSQSPAANSAGWNNSDVAVSWNWTDNGGTGIDAAHCTTGGVSSGEGALTLSANCNDLS